MKNLTLCPTVHDVHREMRKLLRSPIFQQSYDNGGYVYQAVDRYATIPRIMADMSDTHLEQAHFSVWWNVLTRRTYDNPVISDLYYLHEITHASDLAYVPELSFSGFKRKMQDNELTASVTSEIAAYFALPELRAQSFNFPIYVDRFLQDAAIKKRWHTDPENLIHELREKRRDIMLGLEADKLDDVELWIHRYAEQNEQWALIWRKRFREVESAMLTLRQDIATKPHQRAAALQKYVQWLTSAQVCGQGDIPFPLEAEQFAKIYWHNKHEFEKLATALTPTKLAPAKPAPAKPAPDQTEAPKL